MKAVRWLCFFLIMTLIVITTGCQRKKTTAIALMEDILSTNPRLPLGEVIYQSHALPGERSYMTQRLRSLLYDDGSERKLPEFEKVLDYAVCLSDGRYGAEIHIFHMASEADARDMAKLLERRLQRVKRRAIYLYAPEAYENYFSSAVVVWEKEFAMLLSTDNNEKILKDLRGKI